MERASLLAILDLARWAPSGDNSQPWSFRILSEDCIEVLVRDEADCNLYDFDARPSLLSAGFLLESMAIAARRHGAALSWDVKMVAPHCHMINVVLHAKPPEPDTLFDFLRTRSVDRGCYRRDGLSKMQETILAEALEGELEIVWMRSDQNRRRIARINARATHIRLSIPEAFAVHKRILDWAAADSPAGVPARAIGLDPLSLAGMRWAMRKWSRVHTLNRYAAGTWLAQLEMDLLPGQQCAAHFLMFRRVGTANGAADLLRCGRSLQRFWLTAASLGLVMQPSLAPLCFSYYAERGQAFTTAAPMLALAESLRLALRQISSSAHDGELIFMGRIGVPRALSTGPRSVRKPLAELWH